MTILSLLLSEEPRHVVYRPYVVYLSTIALLLSVFTLFVLIGWPGGPIGCIYKEPDDGCYCEAFEIDDVEDGKPGVRQPVNTWCNLFTVLTSGFVAYCLSEDRKKLYKAPENTPEEASRGRPYNPHRSPIRRTQASVATRSSEEHIPPVRQNIMRSRNIIADWYVLAIAFCGLGKMYFHGSLTRWGTYVDGVSSNFFYAFLPWYTFRRVHQSESADQLFWIGYFVSITLISSLQIIFGHLFGGEIMMIFYCFMELYIFATTGVFLGTNKSKCIWFLSLALLLVATAFWWSSRTGRVLCDPDSLWQIHGLVWHPLSNIFTVVLYFYWRHADEVSTEDEQEGSRYFEQQAK
jgi:hypothetical protein